jgi:hypothetical protein
MDFDAIAMASGVGGAVVTTRLVDAGSVAFNPAARLPCVCIVDGSVIPGALATQPTLTITAQALSAMDTALRE